MRVAFSQPVDKNLVLEQALDSDYFQTKTRHMKMEKLEASVFELETKFKLLQKKKMEAGK